MSMLDAFFNKGFKGAKCKTLLKFTLPRIKLLKNRREIQLKQMRKEIAKLLETGQEATARIRVEHIIREQKMMAAHEIIELFCELIIVRLPIIETQRECPLDLKEAISTLCFAAPRCADLPELLQVQMLFAAKYGKEFVAAATELMPDCGVNRQVIELLSVRAPAVEEKLKLLKEIAEEHELDWDPTATETELLKPHEDLLHGSGEFTCGSKVPLPKEKHDETFYSGPMGDSLKRLDSETVFETLDLPDVPQGSIRRNCEAGITPNVTPSPASSQDSDVSFFMGAQAISSCMPQHPGEGAGQKAALATNEHIPGPHSHTGPNSSADRVPQILPLNVGDARSSTSSYMAPDSKVRGKEEVSLHPGEVKLKSPHCVAPDSLSETRENIHSCPAEVDSGRSCVKVDSSIAQEGKQFSFKTPLPSGSSPGQNPPSITRTKIDAATDFQDVLVAAEQAAETAERAAAAARSAASLAQLRITELYTKKNNDLTEIGSNGVSHDKDLHDSLSFASRKHVSSSDEPSYPFAPESEEQPQRSETLNHPSYDTPKIQRESSSLGEQGDGYESSHQPQRSTSIDDDPYFSYPNLFASQGSKSSHAGY